VSHGREKWKSGGQSAQTSEDSDPDWMYHQPAPDPWEQTLNKWEKKSMADKYVVENKAGLWASDRKTADWMDDWSGKIYIAKEGWHWMGGKQNTRENGPAVDIEVRPMDRDQISKYSADIDILTKEEAKQRWQGGGSNGSSQDNSKWMKPAPPKNDNDIPW
jgi:hypothetical protein